MNTLPTDRDARLAVVIPIRRADRRTLDDGKLDALYRRHGDAVFRYVLGLALGDRHLAEDIVQETFLRAWRTPDLATDRPEGCRNWLVTVARNVMVDRVRHRRRRPPEAGDDKLPMVAAPHCEIDRMVTSITVRDALTGLTPAHREILVEVYFRDRSLAEIAGGLGIPLGTAKSRVHYALRALRQKLEGRRPTTMTAQRLVA